MATITWTTAVDGDFADGADWSTGTVPGPTDIAEIEATGTYTVSSTINESVNHLRVTQHATLSIASGTFEVAIGGVVTAGTTIGATAEISVGDGATLELGGGAGSDIALQGALNVVDGGTVKIDEDGGFSGSGIVTLGGAGSRIEIAYSGGLSNFGTIEGAGMISSPGAQFENEGDGGLVNANITGLDLTIDVGGSTAVASGYLGNGGVMEATNGGGLVLTAPVPGAPLFEGGGVVEATGAGSHVDLSNAVLGDGYVNSSGGGLIRVLAGGGTLWGYSSTGGRGLFLNGTIVADNGATLSLVNTINNTGQIEIGSAGAAANLRLASLADFDKRDTQNSRTVFLLGDGAVELSDNQNNLISATHSNITLDNTDNTIVGAGTIGGGAGMSLHNDGVIDATGVNALVIDPVSGTVTNQVHGVIEASGSGGLSFAGGTLANSGTVQALDGSSVTFGADVVITNSSGGTLTGGHWYATDTGDGAGISLSGDAVTTLDGLVKLSGAASAFSAGGEALESSLATIASGGRLELLASRSWDGAMALTDQGLVQLAGGTFQSAGLTVGSSGTILGVGEVSGSVSDDGLIYAQGGALDVSGDVSGTGTVKVLGHTTLELGGSVASSLTAFFNPGAEAVLKLDDPTAFAAVISGWAHSDVIDLSDTDATSAVIDGTTLEVGLSGGGSLDLTLSSAPTGVHVVLSSDGEGGTNLTLRTGDAPAVAQITQAMAGMAPAAGAGAVHAAHAPPAGLATLAAPGA